MGEPRRWIKTEVLIRDKRCIIERFSRREDRTPRKSATKRHMAARFPISIQTDHYRAQLRTRTIEQGVEEMKQIFAPSLLPLPRRSGQCDVFLLDRRRVRVRDCATSFGIGVMMVEAAEWCSGWLSAFGWHVSLTTQYGQIRVEAAGTKD